MFISNHADGIAAVDLFLLPTIAIPDSLLSCHCAPRTTTFGVVWRDGKPDRGVDLAPDHRGPVGPMHRDISFGIETPRMVRSYCSGSER